MRSTSTMMKLPRLRLKNDASYHIVRPSKTLTKKLAEKPAPFRKVGTQLFFSPSLLNLHKSATGIKAAVFPEPVQNGQCITIRLLSNYGDQSMITLSNIQVLDENRGIIPIQDISTIPFTLDPTHISRLVDDNLIKSEGDPVWTYRFSPDGPIPIDIITMIPSTSVPKYVRIWNAKHNPNSSTKNIEIKIGKNVAYIGEVPRAFGFDVPLLTSNLSENVFAQLFPELIPEAGKSDAFGKLPFKTVKSFTIEVLSTHTIESNYVGLNAVDLIDQKHNKVSFDDISGMKFNGFHSGVTGVRSLFKEQTSFGQQTEGFIGERKDFSEIASLTFEFAKDINLVKIVIWNYNVASGNSDVGVRDIRLRDNNGLFWVGRIPQGRFSQMSRESAVTVWLTDSPEYRMPEI